ncbi:MAG: TrkH family potassium uptake protein [Gemmatimonadota bacterium]
MLEGYRLWELGASDHRRGFLRRASATQLLVLSFVLLILVGTLGFLVLPGLYAGPRLGIIDALFTATSAVCVTGLVVVDTATRFTPLGQAWIAILIQLGGLNILTLATLMITLLGRRASLAAEEAAGGGSPLHHIDAKALLGSVLRLTLVIETAGAIALWLAWRGRLGAAGAAWPAVFHAISAFCNAGFSVFSDSLAGFRRSPATLLIVSALIVLGGIGFIVLADLGARYRARSSSRLALHTKLALIATGVLLGGGTLAYFLFESRFQLAGLGWPDRLANAWFMSATARTAGFNTVNYDAISNPSVFLTLLLMLIGGSPGSTAGGMKTTTIVLVGLVFWSRLRGQASISVFDRTVPRETIQRATGLVVGTLIFVGLMVFLLLVTEFPAHQGLDRGSFLRLVFEAHSAFGTVGLSQGVTPALTPEGRLVIILLMFVGRVGPLAVVSSMAAARSRREIHYRYAREDVVIG